MKTNNKKVTNNHLSFNIKPLNIVVLAIFIFLLLSVCFLILKDNNYFLDSNTKIFPIPTINLNANRVTATVTQKPEQEPITKSQDNKEQTSNLGTTDTSVKQVGKYTFEGNLPCDKTMGTANDVYLALNNYRNVHGVGSLTWNNGLMDVASMRTSQIMANGGVSDSHAGFITFTNDQSNFTKLGMSELSENIAGTGNCPLLGVHIIEWLFARDAPHNNAQLDSRWTNVGISVNGSVVGVIFGK